MTAAALGFPDLGLVTMTEMVENAARIARAADIPLIAEDLSAQWGQPVVVENRAGADGWVGTQRVLQQPAEAFTREIEGRPVCGQRGPCGASPRLRPATFGASIDSECPPSHRAPS